MRDFSGMPHGERRKLFERAAFERFCDASERRIVDSGIEQPPEPAPDIRAVFVDEGPIAYELVCLDHDAYQERYFLMGDAQALTRQYHRDLPSDMRTAFDSAFGDAFVMIAFVSTAGKRGVRQALPGLFDALMRLPRGATGQVVDRYSLQISGVERVHIARDQSFTGPEFSTSAGGYVGPLNLGKLKEKLGKKYDSDAPIELLAYATEVAHQSDDDKIREILDRMTPDSVYRRVWIFEQLLRKATCYVRGRTRPKSKCPTLTTLK